MIDSHCHLDPQYFETDRAEVLARARAAGVDGVRLCRGRSRRWRPRARRSRWRRPSPTSSRRSACTRTTSPPCSEADWTDAGGAGARARGWSASARPGSTTTTTIRRASCSRRPTGASSALARAAGLAVVSHVRDAHADAAGDPAARKARADGRHPLLLGRRGRGARLPGPRPAPVVLGHPDLQERGQPPRGGGVRAARPHPDRDRRALPGADPPPRAERTSRPTSPRRWRRWRRCAGLPAAEVDAATATNTRRLFRLAVAGSRIRRILDSPS